MIVVALLLAACGAAPVGTNTTGTEPTTVATTGLSDGSTVGTTWVTPPIASNDDGVAVLVTATPVLQDDGSIELCPPGYAGPCPGIALEGDAGSVVTSAEDGPVVVQVIGWYDGSRLLAAAEPAVADFPPLEEVTFDSLCPDLQGTPSVNPDEGLTERVNEYAMRQPDYAALWWDAKSSTITVWLKGDASAHQVAIAEIAGDEPVCVAGGARFSEAELLEAMDLLGGFVDSRGLPLPTSGYGVMGTQNFIDVTVDEIDTATRASLADLVGERVNLYAFVETLDVPLSGLPAPVPTVAGDVDILTDRIRLSGGMDALGTFELRYDPDLNCVYFTGTEDGDGGRTVPVWPFGFSATRSPMTVYDFDAVPVAAEGDTLELGGGFVGAQSVDGNPCGAESAWIVSWEPSR